MLRIKLFGRLHVERDDRVVELEARKAQELLGYLLVQRDHTQTRDSLATLLWPERPSAQAKSYLRKTLWQLQTGLDLADCAPVTNLQIDGDSLCIVSGPALLLDVADFETTFVRVRGVPGQQLDPCLASDVQNAVNLYHGDLLENWQEEWCLVERERLQQMLLALLDKLMVYCETYSQYEEGIAHGMRILRYDQAHERTHRRLMRLHFFDGDRTGALRQYDRCVDVLQRELGVRPSPRTARLLEQIQLNLLKPGPQSANDDVLNDTARTPLLDALDHLRGVQRLLADVHQQILLDIQAVEHAMDHRA